VFWLLLLQFVSIFNIFIDSYSALSYHSIDTTMKAVRHLYDDSRRIYPVPVQHRLHIFHIPYSTSIRLRPQQGNITTVYLNIFDAYIQSLSSTGSIYFTFPIQFLFDFGHSRAMLRPYISTFPTQPITQLSPFVLGLVHSPGSDSHRESERRRCDSRHLVLFCNNLMTIAISCSCCPILEEARSAVAAILVA
jgi:hypothetical protein